MRRTDPRTSPPLPRRSSVVPVVFAALLAAPLAGGLGGGCRGAASFAAPVPVHGAAQRHPLSCESAAAVALLSAYGISVDEETFSAGLPASDNPDLGFVGSVDAAPGDLPPAGYGVHAEPVAERLRALGLQGARAERGRDAAWLRARLRERTPVLVWVTSDFVRREAVLLHDRTGRAFRAVRWEHAVLAVGHDAGGVRLLDPATGAVRAVPWASFLDAWASLGGMAVAASGVPATGVPTSAAPARRVSSAR